MTYEIIERTTTIYTVDCQDFDNKKDAEAYVLFEKMYEQLTSNRDHHTYDVMKYNPQRVIDVLQQYIRDKAAIYAPVELITLANFHLNSARNAGSVHCFGIDCWADMFTAVDILLKDRKLIDAIEFIRGCFNDRPGLIESKNWVETRRVRLRLRGYIC